ncbi:hypothetical protein LTS15_011194 [Exophiala xenobiotica]|nr:hypothetical protein LTS15_011194 [Exophiala xenobiotica]
MIDFVEHNLEALRNPPQGPCQINDIYVTNWILSFPLSRPERLLAVALITNGLFLDRLHRAQLSPVHNYRVQREFPRLMDSTYSSKSDYVVWALLTLRNTVRFNPTLSRWIDDQLAPVALSEDLLLELQVRYCAIPQLLIDEDRLPDEI